MFERFDERAREAVVLAQEEALALKHDYIGAQHLLLGVLRADPELAAVDPQKIRGLLEPGDAEHSGQMPFSSVAKRSLEQALREAMALGHRRIGAAHLLLALAAERAVRDLLSRADADALADRERTTARAQAAQFPAGPSGPPSANFEFGRPDTDARLLAEILTAGGPVAGFLREQGVELEALRPFLDA